MQLQTKIAKSLPIELIEFLKRARSVDRIRDSNPGRSCQAGTSSSISEQDCHLGTLRPLFPATTKRIRPGPTFEQTTDRVRRASTPNLLAYLIILLP